VVALCLIILDRPITLPVIDQPVKKLLILKLPKAKHQRRQLLPRLSIKRRFKKQESSTYCSNEPRKSWEATCQIEKDSQENFKLLNNESEDSRALTLITTDCLNLTLINF